MKLSFGDDSKPRIRNSNHTFNIRNKDLCYKMSRVLTMERQNKWIALYKNSNFYLSKSSLKYSCSKQKKCEPNRYPQTLEPDRSANPQFMSEPNRTNARIFADNCKFLI